MLDTHPTWLLLLLLLEWRWICILALALQDQQPFHILLADFQAFGSRLAVLSEADFQVVALQLIEGELRLSAGERPIQRLGAGVQLDRSFLFLLLLVSRLVRQLVFS